METQLLENQITGLEAKLKDLRAISDLHHKAKGLDEQAEKARKESSDKTVDLQAAKEEFAELRGKKAESLKETCTALSAKMSEVLPEGRAIFEIEDGAVWIGWEKPGGVKVPYMGLSGGQRVTFDGALCHALMGDGHKIIILEASELDPIHLQQTLNKLIGFSDDSQIIVNTWSAPSRAPEGWKVEVVK
jgi:hypothetical protein